MAMKRPNSRRKGTGEQGYILIAVLFLVAMVLIMLAVAAPKMAADIERDRELELVHRGQQYVRGVKMYYKKFHAYPPNLDALVKTNEIRFLRKRYKDPMTGKDDWHLIHFGENKTPSYGFFGQPLGGVGGSPVAGVGPGGVGQSLGANSGAASNFGSSSFGSPGAGSGIGGTSGLSSGTDPNAPNSTGAAQASGIGAGAGSVAGTDANGNPTNGGSSLGDNGQTFGGAGIIGVESTSSKLGILIWKKKTHFNEWEFWYDPNADQLMMSNNAGTVGTPAGAAGNGGNYGPGGLNSPGTATPSQFNQPPTTQTPIQAPAQPQQ
jgi:type II secretory pathway pseudopilin PulG